MVLVVEGLIFEIGHPNILIITTNNFGNPPFHAENTLKAPPPPSNHKLFWQPPLIFLQPPWSLINERSSVKINFFKD
jgi:hypothetical protein